MRSAAATVTWNVLQLGRWLERPPTGEVATSGPVIINTLPDPERLVYLSIYNF